MKLLFICFLIIGIFTVVHSMNLVEYFDVANDASRVTWAHGVNSRSGLAEALQSKVLMLETDISMGYVNDSSMDEELQPIMAHPPLNTSDINLNDWLDAVINYAGHRKVGIKLDFKFVETLEPSFEIIKSKSLKIDFPMVINADILSGPINPTAEPVNASIFLQLCRDHFPFSTISPGWTTSISAKDESTSHLEAYTWYHVVDMVLALRNANISQQVTFPVRAPFIARSFETLVWLSNVVPNSSFTIWMGKMDKVNITDLALFRQILPIENVYFDLPHKSDLENLKSILTAHRFKPAVSQCGSVLRQPYFTSNKCAIAGSTAIVMTGSCITTFSFPISVIMRQNGFVLKGILDFLVRPSEIHNVSLNSMMIISFGQTSSLLYLHSNGLVKVYTERFGWHTVKETGTTFGFEVSIPNVNDLNSLETIVRLYPYRDPISDQSEALRHKYKLERTKGDDVVFQIITYGDGASVIRHIETPCLHTSNACFTYNLCWFYMFSIISMYKILL